MRKDNNMQKNKEKGENIAFLCETQLNLLNAIVFVLSNEINSKGNSDIYICGIFRDSRLITERVKQSEVFENVYFISPILDIKRKMFALFFPRCALKKYSGNTINFKTRYSNSCFFSTDLFVQAFFRSFEYGNVIRLDDGLASYFGDITYRATKKLLFLNKYVFKNRIIRQFTKLYLNSPDFYNGELKNIICEMPKFKNSREICDILFKIFQYQKNDLYKNHEVIFLTQPFDESYHYNCETERKILELLQELFGERFLVRIHPGQKPGGYDNFCTDKINNMWELECLEQLSDNNILIGTYSTAQIFPKLLLDKEPYIIFLYKLLFDNAQYNNCCKAADSLIPSLIKAYQHKEKIFVPKTFKELVNVLKEVKSGRICN